MKTKQILTAGAIALSMILTGCSSTSTDTKDTKTTEVAKKKEVKTFGQKNKDSKSLKFTNITGKKITVFETKSSSEENFSDNLLEDGDERTLYYTVKENDKLDVKVGLQDQDKTFVFKDVDTVDIKKVDVSLKEDKVYLDVTKKDGSTATLTPSEDSAKTEDEKKDETEVKQEEKKEETAKADSSNKSSSSKPSNNSGSNSSSSKPAEHTHNWVAVTETRTVVDQPAYDEQVPVTEMREHEICSSCGADLTGTDASAHVYQHMINGDDKGGWHSEWREEVTGYQTVHHDAVTHTETVTTGYRCSTCGASK